MIVVFLLLCSNGIQAQTKHTLHNQAVIGSIDSIHSKILNEKREIWIHVPNSALDDSYLKR